MDVSKTIVFLDMHDVLDAIQIDDLRKMVTRFENVADYVFLLSYGYCHRMDNICYLTKYIRKNALERCFTGFIFTDLMLEATGSFEVLTYVYDIPVYSFSGGKDGVVGWYLNEHPNIKICMVDDKELTLTVCRNINPAAVFTMVMRAGRKASAPVDVQSQHKIGHSGKDIVDWCYNVSQHKASSVQRVAPVTLSKQQQQEYRQMGYDLVRFIRYYWNNTNSAHWMVVIKNVCPPHYTRHDLEQVVMHDSHYLWFDGDFIHCRPKRR